MKKSILYMALAATALTMSVTACKSTSAPAETTAATTEAAEAETETTAEETEPNADETPESDAPTVDESMAETEADITEENNSAADQTGSAASGESPAQTLLAAFKEQIDANASLGAQELAEALLANSVIPFAGASMPVEPGFLTGFGEAEITDFEEGVMFAPMIGSIPFMGYVFDLADDADADAFTAALKDNADPRWNICTEAEETVVEAVGDKVFFVMSPAQFEE